CSRETSTARKKDGSASAGMPCRSSNSPLMRCSSASKKPSPVRWAVRRSENAVVRPGLQARVLCLQVCQFQSVSPTGVTPKWCARCVPRGAPPASEPPPAVLSGYRRPSSSTSFPRPHPSPKATSNIRESQLRGQAQDPDPGQSKKQEEWLYGAQEHRGLQRSSGGSERADR